MKTTIPFFLTLAFMASSSFSQTTTEPRQNPTGPVGQPTYSGQQQPGPAQQPYGGQHQANPGQQTSGGQQQVSQGQYQNQNQNQSVAADVSFTNAAGQVFTVDQLTADLRELNDAMARTMPALTAFNDSVSTSTSSGHQSIAGAISNLVSGAINRNGSQNTSQSSQGNAVLNALQSRLRGPGANQNVASDLSKLRNDLQPVAPLLQNLLGTTAGSAPAPDQVISGPRGGTNGYQRPISPTGR
jgi:hypothetical protein